jgi:hypothetical protein
MNATKASLDQSVKPGHEMRTGSLSKISVHQVHAPQHQRPSVGYILEYVCISTYRVRVRDTHTHTLPLIWMQLTTAWQRVLASTRTRLNHQCCAQEDSAATVYGSIRSVGSVDIQ